VTLLESSQRKFRFLNWASAKIKARGLHAVLGRAPQALHGRTFDAVIVRAVTSFGESARLALSLAHPRNGLCVLYQTRPPPVEALRDIGTPPSEIIPYHLPQEQADRYLVILERIGL